MREEVEFRNFSEHDLGAGELVPLLGKNIPRRYPLLIKFVLERSGNQTYLSGIAAPHDAQTEDDFAFSDRLVSKNVYQVIEKLLRIDRFSQADYFYCSAEIAHQLLSIEGTVCLNNDCLIKLLDDSGLKLRDSVKNCLKLSKREICFSA